MHSFTSACLDGRRPTSRNGSTSTRATAPPCSNWRSANMRSDDNAAKLRRLRDTYEPVPDAKLGALAAAEVRFDDAPGIVSEHVAEPLPSLPWLNISNWDNVPTPERQWAIRDRVPLNQVGLFSGEGGTRKSLIEMAKDVAHVAGKDWLGSMPEPGPAFYLGAEDEADEIHIRLSCIARHYSVTFKELYEGG